MRILPGATVICWEWLTVTDKEFIEVFSRQKKAFLKDFEKEAPKTRPNAASTNVDHKKVLDWFERWLKGEGVAASPKGERLRVKGRAQNREQITKSFDQFVDLVLQQAKEMLAARNIGIVYSLPGQSLGISESWKCVKVFGNTDIYFRIGRTRPRKGPRKGEEILVLDLVMDGNKKQVFLPLLKYKDEIEGALGDRLERELPKVEATGKYRLKIMLPIDLVERGDVRAAARKFVDFIAATKPYLNQLGVD